MTTPDLTPIQISALFGIPIDSPIAINFGKEGIVEGHQGLESKSELKIKAK